MLQPVSYDPALDGIEAPLEEGGGQVEPEPDQHSSLVESEQSEPIERSEMPSA